MTADAGGAPLAGADDRILADRAADGDTAAFAELVRRHTPLMRAYARRLLPGTADVDDVVQDAFITAWQRLPDLEETASVKSWLMRITSRKAFDRIRGMHPYDPIEDAEVSASEKEAPARVAEAHAGVAALARALRELPERQRQVWMLREVGGGSYEEIADQLGTTVSTVRGLLARARRHMLVRMEEWR